MEIPAKITKARRLNKPVRATGQFTSRYLGVSRDKSPCGHYRCSITLLDRTCFYVGSFGTEEEAGRAYDLAAIACGRTTEFPNKIKIDPEQDQYVVGRVRESLAKKGIDLRPEHVGVQA
jgi:hypothetical protein